MILASNARRIRQSHGKRRGGTLVEAAIALSVLMLFVVSILDFTIASFRIQMLNHIAHRIAREAIVHGPKARAGWNGGPWGPTAFTTTLAGTNPVAIVGNTVNAGLNPSDVTITVTWPNASNAPGSPVVVEAVTSWSPSLLRPIGMSVLTLRGESRQMIVH